MVRYCGYDNLTKEQIERLFNLIHSNFTKLDLIKATQQELEAFAMETEKRWL